MGPGLRTKLKQGQTFYLVTFLTLWLCTKLEINGAPQPSACYKSRKVFNSTWGIITDGPSGSNYTQDSHCEWLIKAENSSQFITLTFQTMSTECSYDYVFVYDGESFESELLGSFSGKSQPQKVTATSGAMLILLYSDTNYVLDGFRAEFSVTNCLNNCSGHGMCSNHKCYCGGTWGGADCGRDLCPEKCGEDQGRGTCRANRCVCNPGYSGQACSLHRADQSGNRWHWLSHSESGLLPRAAHTAVYNNETDSLFVFGGYNLNTILGDLVVYKFSTSRWEDEDGNELDAIDGLGQPDHHIIATVLQQGEERWGVPTARSFFRNILFSIADNSTLTLRHKVQSGDSSGHLLRLGRDTLRGGEESEEWEGDVPRLPTREPPPPVLHKQDSEEVTEEQVQESYDFENERTLRPAARYGHAACSYNGGFVMYGGKLEGGGISDELWHYNVTSRNWSLRALYSGFRPPRLTRHTLTLVGGWLYLFGGSMEGGEFSSGLYRIKLNLELMEQEQWEEVRPRGGKELDVRMVAHSTVYNARSNSLLVYGGIVAGVARFSKLSDRMFLFHLDSKLWSEIHYPRAHLRDTYVPRERAFHTSTIIGNYLVVFGGYSHRHNKEEICYDNQMYLYHLGCHTWVSHEILGNIDKDWRYPKQQGVFAHAADVRNGNTLLVVGGYHGNVNADLLAYTVPPMLASREGEVFDPEQVCSRHHSLTECTANPECGWCSADEVCYGRTVGSNCTTNLQTTRCPGICPALGDCHSCLIHGNAVEEKGVTLQLSSVAHKLHLDQCTWCVQNARCHNKADNYGVCGLREDTPSQVPGWWGLTGTEVVRVEECRELDRRPGLTFLKYKSPANWSQPDYVTIINATTVDFNMVSLTSRAEQAIGGEIIARLLGFLHPPSTWKSAREMLRVCASYSHAVLSMSGNEKYEKLEVVANLTTEMSHCVAAQWPSGSPVMLLPGRYLVDFESRNKISPGPYATHSKMELHHNKSEENAKVFTFEYLEPYENGSCHRYSNCLHCLTDSLCGWCDLQQRCYPRSMDEKQVCTSRRNPEEWHYFTLLPFSCANCSNYITCESCVNSSLCEWWTEEARCARRGRSANAVVELSQCPVPCYQRSNCSRCLDDRGRCVWCEATQECFSFSVYTSEYQFGLCREWTDHHHSQQQAQQQQLLQFQQHTSQQCKSCNRHANCSSCLHTLNCGWCYSVDNPILGVCVKGDFTHADVASCSLAISEHHNVSLEEDEASWAYAQCPDVDECDLGLHDCHKEAECTNTHGSYSCQCKRGFIGDGKITCTKTCYNKCIHGYCVGAPEYSCKCDLGWTGVDCGLNCGCHNHSTCNKGIGICDECQNWATGSHCQYCRPGSYGNATSGRGCHVCNCNGHGDESKGICDLETGMCFCQDNTEGNTCNRCKPGYYGDPRNGGMCYYQCVSRGMLTGMEPQGLGSRLGQLTPWESRLGAPPTRECLWIVSPNSLQNRSSPYDNVVIQFTIHEDMNITCQENSVYVYDGLPDFVSANHSHQSQVLGIFCSTETKYPVTVEAKSGVLTVYYRQGDLTEGFNASYKILSCPNNCPGNRVCRAGQCICADGWTGTNCSIHMCPKNCNSDNKQGTCDKSYGRCLCAPGFGGEDCSVVLNGEQLVFTQLFDVARLPDSLDHLRKQLPRFGHSLVVDTRGSLWMFGGFSLTNGPLNDIRLFDTKNNTWMQVTVDSTGTANMPQVRYFHAAEIVHSRREIYVFGGVTEKCDNDNKCYQRQENIGNLNSTLNDFWKFSLKTHRWTDITTRKQPPPLGGHTLTLRRKAESESLVLIGGFSPRYGFLESVWEFDLVDETWSVLRTSGNGPQGVYGHSTVYHEPSESFYLFGGYMYAINRTFISNKLYAFHYPTRFWSVLPTFEEYNRARLNLPPARFLHAAVTTDDYMLVFGGRSQTNTSNALIAYTYACNQWVRLITHEVDIVGTPPPPTYGHAMALDQESGSAFVIGGFDGGIQGHVTRIVLPRDLCRLWHGKNKCVQFLGCNHCDIVTDDDNVTVCYSNTRSQAESCEPRDYNARQINVRNGVVCDSKWLSRRNCSQYTTCTECLAKWPVNINENQVCKWCANCPRGRCILTTEDCDVENKCNIRQRVVSDVNQCPERKCAASDCEKCVMLGSCIWTRQVLLSSLFAKTITGEPVFDWSCISDEISLMSSIEIDNIDICPSRCNLNPDCNICLDDQGAEGGWHECRWSIKLGECISPSYQALYCTGGACGLVLRGGYMERCPERCSTYKQCSTCLKHAHCGWCALNAGNSTGQGVCTEGSLDSPASGPAHSTCDVLYFQQFPVSGNTSVNNSSSIVSWNDSSRKEQSGVFPMFSWHYVGCPMENECLNNHHTCDNKSEQCLDLDEGFKCVCGPGYKLEKNMCVPVCTQGCVRGRCIQPNVCRCDFGYIGANCSIQCQCNGHANCAGPDKLDQCYKCHNNTKGAQCEKCKPLFVGDPTNNGQCVPCVEYCNGHTHICINESMATASIPILMSASEVPLTQIPLAKLEEFLVEGPTTHAKCIGCSNRTTGEKCEECIVGNFRGTEDHRAPCRPCECHGHGDKCDPVTGEKCNCQNNTESDVACQNSPNKNSNQQCWKLQCSKCRDSYMGTPTGGHQCYRQMTFENKFCFDTKLLEECKMKPKPLYPGQTVFFAVQPRFMNVDIRVIVDVTQGGLDLFLSPFDDTFVVNVNASTGAHMVEMDPKLHWLDDEHMDETLDPLARFTTVQMSAPGNEVNGSLSDLITYKVMEREAQGLTTFVTVTRRNTFLVVRNLRDRLVLTLPQDKHELGSTRFYIALTAVQPDGMSPGDGQSPRPSYGMIFFRQDQLHIDLFVFFSVFFSCFFLFLAACVVAWKAKQAADVRRARRRHVVEMLHMAKRPFATVTVLLDADTDLPSCSATVTASSSSQSPHRKKQRKQHQVSSSGGDIRPIAVEPTDDGVAAVGTVFVRLPGGRDAPVRLALASSLILLARVYPLNGRAFLRRRSSHAPS